MNRLAQWCCVIAALAGALGCSGQIQTEVDDFAAEPETEGAAGNPAPEDAFDVIADPSDIREAPVDEASAALEEAESLEDLLARDPLPRGVELSEELVIDKKIVGNDNRVRVNHTRAKPYSTIATILVTFPNEARPGLCTGSMIAADAVLTAAHCVYDRKLGGWASTMRVVPGAYPSSEGVTQQPFGSASGVRAFVPDGYRKATKFWEREPHDYAVVRIGTGLRGAFGTRSYGTMGSPRVGRTIKLVGYHGDKCFGQASCSPGRSSYVMHISNDSVRELLPAGAAPADATLFNHYADSNGGSSGSPIVADGVLANTIFAVHVAGFRGVANNTWNMGVLLTAPAVENIKSWAGRKP